jgi:hypothetical protein
MRWRGHSSRCSVTQGCCWRCPHPTAGICDCPGIARSPRLPRRSAPWAKTCSSTCRRAQILLHQHPVNQARGERGLPPVNSLWFWGGGTLPAHVRTSLATVIGDDVLLGALAGRAGLVMQPRTPSHVALARAGGMIDLQDLPVDVIANDWWPSLEPLLRTQAVQWVFASGERFVHRPWHRWRFWRKAGQ